LRDEVWANDPRATDDMNAAKDNQKDEIREFMQNKPQNNGKWQCIHNYE
jgi:hypothetical protein